MGSSNNLYFYPIKNCLCWLYLFCRRLSHCVFCGYDILWHSNFLPRSGHRSIFRVRRHDPSGPIMSHVKRRWYSHNGASLFLRHLLLRHHLLDDILHDIHFFKDTRSTVEYLWYVFQKRPKYGITVCLWILKDFFNEWLC